MIKYKVLIIAGKNNHMNLNPRHHPFLRIRRKGRKIHPSNSRCMHCKPKHTYIKPAPHMLKHSFVQFAMKANQKCFFLIN